MEISQINAIEGALATAKTAAGSAANTGAAPGVGSFMDVLKRSLDQVNAAQTTADTQAKQFQLGQGGVSLEDAMVSMQKANVTFQAAVQVRNKLVSAYSDIMNMQV